MVEVTGEKLTEEEWERKKEQIKLQNADEKADAQRNMAWFSLFGMLTYPLYIIVCGYFGADKAAGMIADIAPTYFGSVAVIVAAFYAVEGYVNGGKR